MNVDRGPKCEKKDMFDKSSFWFIYLHMYWYTAKMITITIFRVGD